MTDRHEQPELPGLEDREFLESLGPDELVNHIIALGGQATQIEHKMNMASTVLEGAYGVTVEDVLIMRQTSNLHLDTGENSGETR